MDTDYSIQCSEMKREYRESDKALNSDIPSSIIPIQSSNNSPINNDNDLLIDKYACLRINSPAETAFGLSIPNEQIHGGTYENLKNKNILEE
jgi:hypothetical protein